MKGKSRPPNDVGEASLTASSSTINDASVADGEDVLNTLPSTSANTSSDGHGIVADLSSSPRDSRAMPSNAVARGGSDVSKVSASGNETDPPVDEYPSDASSSPSSYSKGQQGTATGDFDDEGDEEKSSGSGSRSRSSGSSDDLTGSDVEPPLLSQQGTAVPIRSVDEKGASPLPSTPLRAGGMGKSTPDSPVRDEFRPAGHGDGAGRHAASFETRSDSHAATQTSASPMGPHVRRILEALATFDGPPPDDAVAGQEGETGSAVGRGGDGIEDASEIRRPPRVKNSARSISASSEASSAKRSQAKKKKPRTGYSSALEDKDLPINQATDVEMLDISAIIFEVDRQSLDDELDQLVRELDEAVGGAADGSGGKGIKLRRRSLRRRGRKGRKWRKSTGSPADDPAILNDSSTSLDDSDEEIEEGEESGSPDPRARAFMNMLAAEVWMAKEAYSTDDSFVEDSSCLTFQTEEQVKQVVQGPAAADGQKNEPPAIQALREVWNSFTLGPLFDDKRSTATTGQQDPVAEIKTSSAIEPPENEEGKKSREEPQFLEFIDPAFFEELWKALLSIQLQNCQPLEFFKSPGPTTGPQSECSVTSTIPTESPSFEACDSLSMCSGKVQSEGIDHSAILARCLARGGADGDAAGAAGSSPLAKRKAALLLQQCEKKFPSLYKRIIARLETKAGFQSSDMEQQDPTSTETAMPQPLPIDSDEEDSLFSPSKAHMQETNAELKNKTPRVRNSTRRDNSIVDLSATESQGVDQADRNSLKTETENILVMPPVRESSIHGTNFPSFASERPVVQSEDGTEAQNFFMPSPPDAPEYALLTSFNSSALGDESPPRAGSLHRSGPSDFAVENVDHLAQGVVSPLTVDSRAVQENETHDVERRDKELAEEGVEVTEILADLTKSDSVGRNELTTLGGEGRPVTRVKDLRESHKKSVPILTPKSSDTSRSRRVRHSSVPRGIHSDAISDMDDRDQFPVVLKHRVLSLAGGDRTASTSRLKPRNLEAFLDRTASPKSSKSTSRSLPHSPDERGSPTSFPSLFSKGIAGEGEIAEETRNHLFSRDDCLEDSTTMVESSELSSSLSRSFTLPTPSRPSWTKLDTPPRGSLIDSYSTADTRHESMGNVLGVDGQEFDLNSPWVAFPTPPRGTFRAEREEDKVPILASRTTTKPNVPGGAVPVKGTGKSPTTVRFERSKSSGRAARESAVRMLARPASAAPKARFRRLVSPAPAGKPALGWMET